MSVVSAKASSAAGRIRAAFDIKIAPDDVTWFRQAIRGGFRIVKGAPASFLTANLVLLAADVMALYTVQLLSVVTGALAAAAQQHGATGAPTSAASAPSDPGFFGGLIPVPPNAKLDVYLFVVLTIFLIGFRIFQRRIATRSENLSLEQLRLELHDRLLTAGPVYHKNNSYDSMMWLVSVGATMANQMLRALVATPITQLVPFIAAISVIYLNIGIIRTQSDWVLGILFLVLVLFPIIGWRSAKWAQSGALIAGSADSAFTIEMRNSLDKPDEILLLDAVAQRHGVVRDRLRDQAKAHTLATNEQYASDQMRSSVPGLLQAIFLLYGIWTIGGNPEAVGAIMGLYLFVPQAVRPLDMVITILTNVSSARSSLKGVLDLLEDRPVERAETGVVLKDSDNAIALRHVTMKFDRVTPVLDDVSLDIAPGKVTAIVAKSGGGKSTTLNLIAALTRPDSGTISIGGTPLDQVSLASLRHRVVKVSQYPLFMTASARENFKLGKPDATDAEIETVCHRLGLWPVFAAKQGQGGDVLGYQVHIEDSRGLSGGERRRFAVARALLSKPSILLLDEPTTGLDALSRQEMCETLSQVLKGMTVVLVDHNIEFVEQMADQVYCLQDGKVVAIGPPNELLARESLFAELKQAELNPLLTGETATRPVEEWRALVKSREREGEYLVAFDLARKGLNEYPLDEGLRYLAVRTLARSGATQLAADLYERYGLERDPADDAAALRARILKDEAWRATGDARIVGLRRAAASYADVFRRNPQYYEGINAATLLTLAGDESAATAMAEATQAACDREASPRANDTRNTADRRIDDYYLHATYAELALLRGDAAAAREALTRAMAGGFDDWAAMATTHRQLIEIVRYRNLPLDALAPLRLPPIIHYVGHMIAPPGKPGRFPAEQEHDVAARIAAYLAEHEIGIAYGSLACGADILFAEAILARGAKLNVVLPFNLPEFKSISVERGGPGWSERFDACLAKAQSVTYATEDHYLGDSTLFPYATRLAMGIAILRAEHLGAEIAQVAVWDGVPASPGDVAGTAIDVAHWQAKGRRTDAISVIPSGVSPLALPAVPSGRPTRHLRALLFGDFHGYSQLGEADVPYFQGTYMRAIGDVLDGFGDAVLYRNTWGDAIYVVMNSAADAARCALAIQAKLPTLDQGPLPVRPELRLAGHYGPTFDGYDAVRKEKTYFGAHVTRAARLEPVTPAKLVYVTEPFAAALAMDDLADFSCEYVGQLPAAKNYGTMRMYMLRSVGA